jgi:hypothetical protein
MIEERRQVPRVRTYLPIRIQPSGASAAIETLTRDISHRGVRCLAPTAIPAHTPVRVDLTLPIRRSVVSLSGQTQWLREMPHSDQFEVGIVFVSDPPEEYRQIFSNYFLGTPPAYV